MFMGISRHPGPVDVAALHPLLHAGQATLAAAKIGTALFGAGYASDANFTTGCGPGTVRRGHQASPPGRPAHRRQNPATRNDSWHRWPPGLIIPAVTGSCCHAARFRPF
jgi:hypothetical protein